MKPLKRIDCLQEEIVTAVGKEKAEVELLHVDADLQTEIISANNSDLQKEAVQVEKLIVKLLLKLDQVCCLRRNMRTTKNSTVSCA